MRQYCSETEHAGEYYCEWLRRPLPLEGLNLIIPDTEPKVKLKDRDDHVESDRSATKDARSVFDGVVTGAGAKEGAKAGADSTGASATSGAQGAPAHSSSATPVE